MSVIIGTMVSVNVFAEACIISSCLLKFEEIPYRETVCYRPPLIKCTVIIKISSRTQKLKKI